MSTPIYPMAMKPKKNMTFELYFLAFPKEWKDKLIELQSCVNPKFNPELYPLYTNVLYGYLKGWLDDVVSISTLKKHSDDTRWFVSFHEITSEITEHICEIIKIWLAAEYMGKEPEKASELMDIITADKLSYGLTFEKKQMFDENGVPLTDYAFDTFAMYAAEAINGKTISVNGKSLALNNCGTKKLISQPIIYKNNAFALGIELSMQTTPPERKCILLINCIIKRFISNINDKYKNTDDPDHKNIFLKENINAYVKTGRNKYRTITMNKYPRCWNTSEKSCFEIYSTKVLPDAVTVLTKPENFFDETADLQILLPYKNGMYFSNMKIGTGVPIKDKRIIFEQLSALMKEFAEPLGCALNVRGTNLKPQNTKANPDADRLRRRHRLKSCTEKERIDIEIYGHNETNGDLQNKIMKEFIDYLGGSEYDDIFMINIRFCDIGNLDCLMNDGNYNSVKQRIGEVSRSVKKTSEIIGAMIILPDYRELADKNNGDPKQALRAGFADTNRITQFITPTSKNENQEHSKIHGAVTDLLRQFGFTDYQEKKKINPIHSTEVVGIEVYKQLEPLFGKSKYDRAKFLPIYVTYNLASGRVFVDCDLFDKSRTSYPEAQILLSKLSRNEDFVKRCNDASKGGLRSKLEGLKHLYRNTPGLIVIKANGTTRQLWNGLTDKKIREYKMIDTNIPQQIDLGIKGLEVMSDLNDSQLRIVRIRNNQAMNEIPDYYSELKGDEHIQASGLYRYENIYWGLENRPLNNPEYYDSYKHSKFTDPTKNHDECALVEIYPLQLQQGDNTLSWVRFVNSLREVMPEVSRKAVRSPAPLHFAELMEEYLLIK